jgi:hypothetical protein
MGNTKLTAAGRDVITRENSTHIEHQTRHVYVKEGWSLFRYDNVATATSGFSGIGIVGEVLLAFIAVVLLAFAVRRCTSCRTRHESYKAFYRVTAQNSATRGRPIPITWEGPPQADLDAEYGPATPKRAAPQQAARTTRRPHIQPKGRDTPSITIDPTL